MNVAQNKNLFLVIICIIVIFIIVSRFYKLDADPDTTLSLSRVFYTDEGLNSCNAVSKYLTGNWICDDHNHILLMPIMSLIHNVTFKLLGLSLISARIPVALFSLIIIAIMVIFVYTRMRSYEERESDSNIVEIVALSMSLIATNYYYFNYSRLALLDIPMLAFGIISYYLLYKALRATKVIHRHGLFVISGILLGISYMTKPSAALFGCTMIVYVATSLYINRRMFMNPLIGILVILSVTIILVFIANNFIANEFKDYQSLVPGHLISDRISIKPFVILRNYVKFFNNLLVKRNILLFFLAGVNFLIITVNAYKTKKINPVDHFMVVLLAVCYIFHGYMLHQVPRYFMVFFVPLVYLTATLPFNIKKFQVSLKRYNSTRLANLALAVILLICAWNLYKIINYYIHPKFTIKSVAMDVKNDILKDAGQEDSENIVLHGDFAATLSIVNHMKFAFSLESQNRPRYVLTQGVIEDTTRTVTLLASYDMLNNYWCWVYGSKRVYLYRED